MLLLLLATAHALDLDVTDLVRGEPTTLSVTGAPPGATVFLITSASGGADRCAPGQPACLGLEPGVPVGVGRADDTGAWQVTFVVPADAALADLDLRALVTLKGVVLGAVVTHPVLFDLPQGPTWVVDEPEELADLAHLRDTATPILVRDLEATDLVLPALRRATGAALTFEGLGTERLSLPDLREVDRGGCPSGLVLQRNPDLTQVTTPSLVTGSVCAESNGPYALDAPVLRQGGHLSFASTGRRPGPPTDVRSLWLPALSDVALLDVYYTRLSSLSLPALRSAAGPLQVWHNSLLSDLDLPALRQAPLVVVVDNPSLSSCEVDRLLETSGLHAGHVQCRANLLEARCGTAGCRP